ncbi:MAG: hypothetical protein ACRD43_06255 [Pyrinomonadaceae bacterium]
MIFGGIGAVIGVVVVLLLAKQNRDNVNAQGGCPECGTPVPAVRNPTSIRQALWGGWTCQNCGTEMDRHGEQIAAPAK